MPRLQHQALERRALTLVEQLVERLDDRSAIDTLLADEPDEVSRRVRRLLESARVAEAVLPTEINEDPVAAALATPDQVGPFRLVRPIGEGGMGRVWRAVRNDGHFEQTVAVKLISPDHYTPGMRVRFEAERRILARLDHAGIARIIDGGVSADGQPWLAMEYVRGSTILEHCDDQRLDLGARMLLVEKVCSAVQAAHARLIVHADLKPGNLMVARDGEPKLLDFGIARLLDATNAEGELPFPVTPAYASPARQAGAPPGVTDDIFALGRIVADLAGATPPEDLSAIVARATAHDENARYPTVEALGRDLARWRQRLPVFARRKTWRYIGGRFVERHPAGVVAATLAVLCLVAITALATVNAARANRARAESVARAEDLRAIAGFAMSGLQDELERRPQTLSLRRNIAQLSQNYLDRLAASATGSAADKVEAARALQTLARRQGLPGAPNIGRPDLAKANLARAAALLGDVPGPQAAAALVDVDLDRGVIATMVDNDTAAAGRTIDAAGRLIARFPRPLADKQQALLLARADLASWEGRYREALSLAREAAAAPGATDPLRAALNGARALDVGAEALWYGGNERAALEPYRSALGLLLQAERRFPREQTLKRAIARAYWNLGSTLVSIERPAEGLAALDQAVARARARLAFDGEDRDATRMLSVAVNARAQALAALHRVDEALADLATQTAAREQVWRLHPEVPGTLRDYVMSVLFAAEIEAAAGRTGPACLRYGAMIRLFGAQARQGHLTVLDDRVTLGKAREAFARHCKS